MVRTLLCERRDGTVLRAVASQAENAVRELCFRIKESRWICSELRFFRSLPSSRLLPVVDPTRAVTAEQAVGALAGSAPEAMEGVAVAREAGPVVRAEPRALDAKVLRLERENARLARRLDKLSGNSPRAAGMGGDRQ